MNATETLAFELFRADWPTNPEANWAQHVHLKDRAYDRYMLLATTAAAWVIDTCLIICRDTDTLGRAENDMRDYRIHITGKV